VLAKIRKQMLQEAGLLLLDDFLFERVVMRRNENTQSFSAFVVASQRHEGLSFVDIQ